MRPLFLLLVTLSSATTLAQDATSVAAPAPSAPAPAGLRTYALSASQSDLYVVIRNDTSATLARMGHDHVIYATGWSGTVTWPADGVAGCKVNIKVPVMKLVVDPPGLRAKAGLDENTITDDDKSKLSKNMWGSAQLDADAFGSITYTSTACTPKGDAVEIAGTLTVRGTAAPVTLTMKVDANEAAFVASGTFETSHTALGFKPFAATAFGPRNQDRLTFAIRTKGTPTP